MRPPSTMPESGEFLARYAGRVRSGWMHCKCLDTERVTSLSDGHDYSRSTFDAWIPVPTENHRLVTTGALEELISTAIRFGACSESDVLKFEQMLNRARTKVGLLAGGPDR